MNGHVKYSGVPNYKMNYLKERFKKRQEQYAREKSYRDNYNNIYQKKMKMEKD